MQWLCFSYLCLLDIRCLLAMRSVFISSLLLWRSGFISSTRTHHDILRPCTAARPLASKDYFIILFTHASIYILPSQGILKPTDYDIVFLRRFVYYCKYLLFVLCRFSKLLLQHLAYPHPFIDELWSKSDGPLRGQNTPATTPWLLLRLLLLTGTVPSMSSSALPVTTRIVANGKPI